MYFLVLLSGLLASAAGVPLNTTKPMPDGRVTGGTVTDITSHPYHVSVHFLGTYWCSGSIISANRVVTLAWCVDGFDPSYISVRSGSTYSNSGGTLHSATSVIIHERYDPDNYWDYDVAIVQVSPAFTFSASVQPITLECNTVPVGTDVVLTGWGSSPSEIQPLEEVTLQTISEASCNSFHNGHITDRMICTADPNGGKGACGDMGSPLVASNKLVGMYGWGGSCGYPEVADVYTNVSAVCDWVVINACLFKFSPVIDWINAIPSLQTMPLTYIATYPNN